MIRDFFAGLPGVFLDVYRGKNIAWHVVAVALTLISVMSGFDWWFFQATRFDGFYFFVLLAGIGGFFVPVLIPVILYVLGEVKANADLMRTSTSVAQASLVAYVVTIIYKSFTGRHEPEFLTTFSSLDISGNFEFGFLEYGIFWGWPSSHAAVACAGAAVIVLLYRSNFIRVPAILWALIVTLGAGVGFHWFSDAIAGAIIGTLVGVVVARRTKTKAPAHPPGLRNPEEQR